jgi:organic radical activating enzyme
MKIHNIRMGLATNSSSTHSLIFMSPDVVVGTDEYGDFGWDFFTAADRTSKENYLGYILKHSLDECVGEENANIILNSIFSNRDNFANQLAHAGYGIDHQSMPTLPVNWNGKGLNLEFFRALKDYVLNNPIIICGGNDNTDEKHPLQDAGVRIDFGLPEDCRFLDTLVARNDGTHWAVFDRNSGTKVRLSFQSKSAQADMVSKAKTPELVDIKITNFCPYGCEFCYQSSTTEGAHAESDVLYNMAATMRELKVFEVAFGGGEPTLHPHFKDILKYYRSQDVVPNFTTKNLAWIRNDKDREEILEACGAFAFSVQNGEEVRQLAETIKAHSGGDIDRGRRNKVSVQYVLHSGGNLYSVLEEARKHYFRVTLLGFKETGFGKGFAQVPENWIEDVKKAKKLGWMNLGVDTAIVQKYGARIQEELGVSDKLMTAEEGKFSMYIDAVTKKIAPSSYCDDKLYEPLPLRGKYIQNTEFEAAFSRW